MKNESKKKPSLESNGPVSEAPKISLCPYSRAMHAYHLETRDPVFVARACRRKGCEVCERCKQAALVQRIVRAAPSKFITLTCRHENGPAYQARLMGKQLSQWTAGIRKSGKPLEYVRILEECADGYPHYHLLARMPYVPQAELAQRWESKTGAKVLDVRVAHGRSTRYVSKYITKSFSGSGFTNRQKLSATRGFWRDEAWETDVIGHREIPDDPWTAAENLSETNSLVRLRRGVYWLWEREPGDELPEELQKEEPANV